MALHIQIIIAASTAYVKFSAQNKKQGFKHFLCPSCTGHKKKPTNTRQKKNYLEKYHELMNLTTCIFVDQKPNPKIQISEPNKRGPLEYSALFQRPIAKPIANSSAKQCLVSFFLATALPDFFGVAWNSFCGLRPKGDLYPKLLWQKKYRETTWLLTSKLLSGKLTVLSSKLLLYFIISYSKCRLTCQILKSIVQASSCFFQATKLELLSHAPARRKQHQNSHEPSGSVIFNVINVSGNDCLHCNLSYFDQRSCQMYVYTRVCLLQ